MLRTSQTPIAETSSKPSAPDWPQWLTRREAADYLWTAHGIQFGVAALANAAVKGTGPAFSKQGGRLVSYWRPDVDEWARTRMSRKIRSTSELRLPPAA
jgi:hypothetical protein